MQSPTYYSFRLRWEWMDRADFVWGGSQEVWLPGENDCGGQDFRFLTRFHYWAADTLTYGEDAPWGEQGEEKE